MKVTITPKSGARTDNHVIFQDKDLIRIGRDKGNDVVFDDPDDRTVSAFHAEIRITKGSIEVVDMDSTNGLLVDGERTRRAMLLSGQSVRLGPDGPLMVVEFQDHSALRDSAKPMSAAKTGRKYGERTVGMIIQQALAQAGLFKNKRIPKTTAYLKALVEEQIQLGIRNRKALVISTIVLLLGGFALGFYVYRNRSVQVYQTTNVNYGDAVGSSIAAANRHALFLLTGYPKSGGAQKGFCTAFAIAEDILATNAHCIHSALQDYQGIVAIMNGAANYRYPIREVLPHPNYVYGSVSPDVGLLRIDGKLVHLVSIASSAELAQVAPGTPVFLYGFPGRLNNLVAPEGTFTTGEIGRVTRFDQQVGRFENNTLLQHSAFSSGGTSGSPMFNSQGHVVGINAGGYSEKGQALVGYNFGVRIDVLLGLLSTMQRRP